jgi:putative DNA primase/helicase
MVDPRKNRGAKAMSKFHRDDQNGGGWSHAQQEARMRHRDRKSTGAKRKHNVTPIETLFPLDEARGRGFGSAEDKTRLAEIVAFRGIVDHTKPPFDGGLLHFACCETMELHDAFFAGAIDILEVNVINNASGAPQFFEVRYRIDGVDAAGVKRFAIMFRGMSDYHFDDRTGTCPEVPLDEWSFLAKAGLLIFHGADELAIAAKTAEANHSTVTVFWCEGMHSKAGVEALLAHPDNLAGVETYKRLNRTEIVVCAWLSGLPGIMATNFELRPDEHFVSPINDYKFDWREFFIDRVIVIPDTDNEGMIEAKALVNRLTEEFGLPRRNVDMARHPIGLKKSQIEKGWDDHDPLPHGMTRQERLAQILDAPPFETRETILVHPDHMHEAVDAVEKAMIDAGDYYQHGGEVATIGAPPVIVAKRGRRKKKDDGGVIGKNQMERAGQRIYAKSEHGVMEAMSRVARYEEPDRKGKLHAIPPPMSIAKMLMARGEGLKLPLLKTVLDRPTINAEGELMLTPGYDAETGLFLAFNPSDFPAIPDRPTKDDAREGLEILKGLCPEFPFVTPADRSVYLAYLLTSVSRTAFKAAPIFGFNATKPRTGKSKLSNSGHMISNGETASVVTWSAKEEENETRLDTALLAGVSNLSVDNINGVVRSAKLCSMATEEKLTIRVFHTQKKKDMPSVALVSMNGNNLQFAGELAKRILSSSLDADVDKPELRVFTSVDPVEQIREDRGKFVMAALTILRAFVVAEYPVEPPPWGGFEDWSNWVRASLIWLGEPDPYEVMNAAIENDEERQQQKRMFAALEGVFVVEETFTTADVVKAAKERRMMEKRDSKNEVVKDANGEPVLIDQGPKHPALADVVTEIAMRGRDISAGVLGKWFGGNKNLTLFEDDEKRRTFKRKLIEVTKIDGSSLWMLKGKRPSFAGPD